MGVLADRGAALVKGSIQVFCQIRGEFPVPTSMDGKNLTARQKRLLKHLTLQVSVEEASIISAALSALLAAPQTDPLLAWYVRSLIWYVDTSIDEVDW